MNETGRKIGVFLVGGVTALLLLEGGLRVFYALQQNREGQRSPEAARTVLCIGDSFVYGLGAPREKSYPKQLQQLLGQDYTVINMGMGGQNSTDVLEGLRNRIQTIDPDVVVILCGSANLWNLRGSDKYVKSRWAHLYDRVSELRTCRLVKLLLISLKDKTGRASPLRQSSHSEMNGYTGNREEHDGGARPPSQSRRKWRKYPDFRKYTDAETAAVRRKYESGIRSDPSDMGNYQGLGFLYLQQRDYAAAVRYLKIAVQKDPANTFNYLQLTKACDEMRRYDEAVAYAEKTLEIDPDEYEAYECLGYVYQHMSRDLDALRAFCKSLELYPASDHNRYKGLVLISRSSHNPEARREAKRLLREYVQKAKATSPTLMSLISEEENRSNAGLREWIQGDVREILGICRERNAGVILMNYPSDFENLNGILRDIAGKFSLPFVDNNALFEPIMRTRRGEYFVPDGHCNEKGYGVMALNVYTVMLQYGYAAKHE